MHMQMMQVLDRIDIASLKDLTQLKHYLCPVFAKTPDEQQLFYELFDAYAKDASLPLEAPKQTTWWQHNFKWLATLAVTTALSLLALTIYITSQEIETNIAFSVNDQTIEIGDTLICDNNSMAEGSEFLWELVDASGEIEQSYRSEDPFESWHIPFDTFINNYNKTVRLSYFDEDLDSLFVDSTSIQLYCADFPEVEKLLWPNSVKSNTTTDFEIIIHDTLDYQYRWFINGVEIRERSKILREQFSMKGTNSIIAKISLPNQIGFCTRTIQHTLTVEDELPIVALQTIPLEKQPVELLGALNLLFWSLFGVLLLFSAYLWYKWWRSRSNSSEEEEDSNGGHVIQAPDQGPYFIPFRFKNNLIKNPKEIFNLSNFLRTRQEGLRKILDIPASLKATIDKGGYPTLSQKRSTQPIEYLFLIDKSHRESHQAMLFEHLVNFLKSKDIYAEYYFYNKTFHSFWKTTDGESFTLSYLSRYYSNNCLVIVGDAHGLLSEQTKGISISKQYQSLLNRWAGKVIMTPQPSIAWSAEEAVLHQLFEIYPADTKGWTAAFETNERRSIEDSPSPFKSWRAIQQKQRKDEEIDTSLIRWRSIDQLKAYCQSTDGLWEWLCALAVYPSLHWSLTLAIGNALENDDWAVNHNTLLKLSRVPYLQKGHFPTSLRLKLLAQLDRATELKARKAVEQELKAIEPLTKNSYVNFETQANLVVQQFLIEPELEEHQINLQEFLKQHDNVPVIGNSRLKELNQQIDSYQVLKGIGLKNTKNVAPKNTGVNAYLEQYGKKEEQQKAKIVPEINRSFFVAIFGSLAILALMITALTLNNTSSILELPFTKLFVSSFDQPMDAAGYYNNEAVDLHLVAEDTKDKQAQQIMIDSVEQLLELAISEILKERNADQNMAKDMELYQMNSNPDILDISQTIPFKNYVRNRYNKAVSYYSEYHTNSAFSNGQDYLINAMSAFESVRPVESVRARALDGLGLANYYYYKALDEPESLLNASRNLDSVLMFEPYFYDTITGPSLLTFVNQENNEVRFHIIDKVGLALENVEIIAPLNNIVTNKDGEATLKIKRGLNRKFEVQILKVGYQPLLKAINLDSTNYFVFEMRETPKSKQNNQNQEVLYYPNIVTLNFTILDNPDKENPMKGYQIKVNKREVLVCDEKGKASIDINIVMEDIANIQYLDRSPSSKVLATQSIDINTMKSQWDIIKYLSDFEGIKPNKNYIYQIETTHKAAIEKFRSYDNGFNYAFTSFIENKSKQLDNFVDKLTIKAKRQFDEKIFTEEDLKLLVEQIEAYTKEIESWENFQVQQQEPQKEQFHEPINPLKVKIKQNDGIGDYVYLDRPTLIKRNYTGYAVQVAKISDLQAISKTLKDLKKYTKQYGKVNIKCYISIEEGVGQSYAKLFLGVVDSEAKAKELNASLAKDGYKGTVINVDDIFSSNQSKTY